MGHARALLALDNPTLQIKLFQQIIQENLSVRKVEEMVKALTEGESVKSGGKKSHRREHVFPKNTTF